MWKKKESPGEENSTRKGSERLEVPPSSSSICAKKILGNEVRSGNRNLNPSLSFTKKTYYYFKN